MIGGYLIIDLGGASLSANPVRVAGVYQKVDGASRRKSILLENWNINGVERHSAFCQATPQGNEFTLLVGFDSTGYVLLIKIKPDDTIVYSRVGSSANLLESGE